MPPTAIQAHNLGKQYRLGHLRARAGSFRELLGRGLAAPLHNLRRLRRLGQTGDGGDDLMWALQEVSFEVRQSEVLGIVGNNGAGKSTLLKVLSRITSPTTGRALVDGRIGSLLEVGTGFHPELTGRDNVYLNGAILGMERSFIANRFDEIVEFAQVAAFLDTPVKHYSSGMYLRLAFAVAAHLPAEILVVDEVLAVGDAEFQRKCLGKMSDVASEGRTILFVSHNLNAIQRLCPRSILLERGRLVADGETTEVLQRYLALDSTSLGPTRWIDLSSARRSGSREVYIQALQYGSDRPELGFQAYPDGPLDLKLAVVSDVRRSVGAIGLSFQGESGAKLIEVDTVSLCPELALHEGRNVIGLRIDALHLNPGVYQLALWATDPVTRRAFDRLEGALPLQVVEPDSAAVGRRGATTCRLQVLSLE
jgi:ABC-type polysaccharide/polyol phosphate transport system ATPase subunit